MVLTRHHEAWVYEADDVHLETGYEKYGPMGQPQRQFTGVIIE
jgi:hypothetical protein